MNASNCIKSFAIIDIETTNIPQLNFNKANITEICVHGISAQDVRIGNTKKTPRVLHKLTMLFNPFMMIHPEATNCTGLDNFMLENESKFDDNSCNVLIGFLKRLQQPTCLIAHNGMIFDFPIIKRTLMKFGLEFPSAFLCVDSLMAFQEIDEASLIKDKSIGPEQAKHITRTLMSTSIGEDHSSTESTLVIPINGARQMPLGRFENSESNTNNTTPINLTVEVPKTDFFEEKISPSEILAIEEHEATLIEKEELEEYHIDIDGLQKKNETTPKRPTNLKSKTDSKRRKVFNDSSPSTKTPTKINLEEIKCKKSLFSSPPHKKYPPKGLYKLGNIYKRIFEESPKVTHQAEADVEMLERIILHYGPRFLKYAEEHAIALSSVPDI